MPASDVRSVMLRTMFDQDFHQKMLTSPDTALADYNLTDQEKAILKNPTAELYRFVSPATDAVAARGILSSDAAPSPVTVTVIIVVAIVVFAVVTGGGSGGGIHIMSQKYAPLVDAIGNAQGKARYDLIKTLVNELTKEA